MLSGVNYPFEKPQFPNLEAYFKPDDFGGFIDQVSGLFGSIDQVLLDQMVSSIRQFVGMDAETGLPRIDLSKRSEIDRFIGLFEQQCPADGQGCEENLADPVCLATRSELRKSGTNLRQKLLQNLAGFLTAGALYIGGEKPVEAQQPSVFTSELRTRTDESMTSSAVIKELSDKLLPQLMAGIRNNPLFQEYSQLFAQTTQDGSDKYYQERNRKREEEYKGGYAAPPNFRHTTKSVASETFDYTKFLSAMALQLFCFALASILILSLVGTLKPGQRLEQIFEGTFMTVLGIFAFHKHTANLDSWPWESFDPVVSLIFAAAGVSLIGRGAFDVEEEGKIKQLAYFLAACVVWYIFRMLRAAW